MNVYCVKDGNLMVKQDNEYVCLKCEYRVRVEWTDEDLGTQELLIKRIEEKEEGDWDEPVKSCDDGGCRVTNLFD